MSEITQEEWVQWFNSEPTRFLINAIKDEQKVISDEIMSGMYIDNPLAQAAKIGEVSGLNRLADIKLDLSPVGNEDEVV